MYLKQPLQEPAILFVNSSVQTAKSSTGQRQLGAYRVSFSTSPLDHGENGCKAMPPPRLCMLAISEHRIEIWYDLYAHGVRYIFLDDFIQLPEKHKKDIQPALVDTNAGSC